MKRVMNVIYVSWCVKMDFLFIMYSDGLMGVIKYGSYQN